MKFINLPKIRLYIGTHLHSKYKFFKIGTHLHSKYKFLYVNDIISFWNNFIKNG